MRLVWKLALIRFRNWLWNPRVGAAFLLGIGLSFHHIARYFSFADDLHSSVEIFEVYILLGSRIPAFLGVLLGGLLLVADAPFCSGLSKYEILRAGKRTWCMSCLLYLVLASFVYSAGLLFFTTGVSVLTAECFADDRWSSAMRMLALKQPEFVIIKYAFSFPFPDFITLCSPYQAMILTFIFQSFYMIVIGECILIVNLFTNRNMGWLLALVLHMGGYLIYANGGWMIPLKYSLLCCSAPAYQFCSDMGMSFVHCLGIYLLLIGFLSGAIVWMGSWFEYGYSENVE